MAIPLATGRLESVSCRVLTNTGKFCLLPIRLLGNKTDMVRT